MHTNRAIAMACSNANRDGSEKSTGQRICLKSSIGTSLSVLCNFSAHHVGFHQWSTASQPSAIRATHRATVPSFLSCAFLADRRTIAVRQRFHRVCRDEGAIRPVLVSGTMRWAKRIVGWGANRASCSSEIPGDSWRGYARPSPGFRANTAHATGTSLRGL